MFFLSLIWAPLSAIAIAIGVEPASTWRNLFKTGLIAEGGRRLALLTGLAASGLVIFLAFYSFVRSNAYIVLGVWIVTFLVSRVIIEILQRNDNYLEADVAALAEEPKPEKKPEPAVSAAPAQPDLHKLAEEAAAGALVLAEGESGTAPAAPAAKTSLGYETAPAPQPAAPAVVPQAPAPVPMPEKKEAAPAATAKPDVRAGNTKEEPELKTVDELPVEPEELGTSVEAVDVRDLAPLTPPSVTAAQEAPQAVRHASHTDIASKLRAIPKSDGSAPQPAARPAAARPAPSAPKMPAAPAPDKADEGDKPLAIKENYFDLPQGASYQDIFKRLNGTDPEEFF